MVIIVIISSFNCIEFCLCNQYLLFSEKLSSLQYMRIMEDQQYESQYILFFLVMNKKLCNSIQQILKYFDLFPFSSFVRFQGQTDYKTATGGFFSISVIVLFAALFTNLGIKTINREIINWSSSITNSQIPSLTNIILQKQSFMFAISIMGININDPSKKYFDITVSQRQVKTGMIPIGSKSIAMEPCTQIHFSKTDTLKKSFNDIPNSKSWLCPKIGSSFELFGKFGSQTMKYLKIDILKCDSSLNQTRKCVNQTEINARQATAGPFILGFFFVNPLINAGDSNYLDYYIQDKNFFTFSTKLGAFCNLYLQQFSIQTDRSILPYALTDTDRGFYIPGTSQNNFYQVVGSQYATVMLFKSSTQISYQRSFYKLDDLLSYIGGLVGIVLIGLFFLTSYSQFSFQHQMGKALFKYKEPITAPNFITYIQMSFFTMFRSIFQRLFECSKLNQIFITHQQVGKQLDLSLLINRILFLEKSIRIIFDSGQLQALQLTRKETIENSKKYRQYYNANNFISLSQLSCINSSKKEGSFNKICKIISENQNSQQKSFDDENKQSFIVSLSKFEESLKTSKKKSLKVYRQLMKDEISQQQQIRNNQNLDQHASHQNIINQSAYEHLNENMSTVKIPVAPHEETFNFDEFQ